MQSIGEARIVIEDAIAGVTPERASESTPTPGSTLASKAPWALAAVLLVALAALGWAWYPRPSVPPAGLVHFTIAPPETTNLSDLAPNASQQVLSPDGRSVAFVADEDGVSSIWVRPLGALAAQRLDGTESAAFPFWSSDSQSLAFFQAGRLRRIPAAGGSPLAIADAPAGEGGTWNRDGVIVFAPAGAGPLHRVAASGGGSEPVTQLEDGEFRPPRQPRPGCTCSGWDRQSVPS